MPRPANEQALIDRFSATYRALTSSATMLEIERAVCGCDYGCTSWTTRGEADTAAGLLGLSPGVDLLDIGSGSGWPGLYLAKETGCTVTLSDLPLEGLQIARQRAEADGLACAIVQADGAALPFRDRGFDALFHSDVLCCLMDKQGVLGSCRRVVRDSGRMVFSVILIAPGLSDADYAVAVDGGPTFIETGPSYPEMLDRAGWTITGHTDLTADYIDTFAKMYALEQANEDELVKVHGAEGAKELLARREANLIAIERGLLRRELFSVVPVP
ncbi:MAG: class I SAM-dependent methyltransferase [Alphaproteobacteria bacterium]|nr:class I SAM-dependent methyltransferase [Alphaproteobacteria bacterium]